MAVTEAANAAAIATFHGYTDARWKSRNRQCRLVSRHQHQEDQQACSLVGIR